MPAGPPILCAETLRATSPAPGAASVARRSPRKSMGSCPYAAIASTCSGTPARAVSRATSATGWTVPTSLLAQSIVTSATDAASRSSAACSASTRRRPTSSSGSSSTTAPSCAASHSTVSIVAWCSPAGTRMRGAAPLPAGTEPCRLQKSPLIARFTASVPLPVNTTSMPSAPSVAAMRSRDSSRSRLACWPGAVDRRRIADDGERGGERLDRLRPHRGGRGVVEVDHGVPSSASVPRRDAPERRPAVGALAYELL